MKMVMKKDQEDEERKNTNMRNKEDRMNGYLVMITIEKLFPTL